MEENTQDFNNASNNHKHFVPPPPPRKHEKKCVPANEPQPEPVPAEEPAIEPVAEEKSVPANEPQQKPVPATKPSVDKYLDMYLAAQKEMAELKKQLSEVEKLKAQLAEQEAIIATKTTEVQKFKDALAHSIADFDNYRRRTAEETPKNILYGKASLAKDLLPVVDNFKLALESIKKTNPEAGTLIEGVEMIEKQLLTVFNKHEIVEINPVGEVFNPQEHDALSVLPSAEIEEDHIMFVQRTGFKLGAQLLRPASVVVAKKAE